MDAAELELQSRTESGASDADILPRKHRYRSAVWLQSLRSLAILLGNAVFCVACAWAMTFALSRGNIFAGESASEQSEFEYLAAVVIMSHVGFYVVILVVHIQYTSKVFAVSVVMEVPTLYALQLAPLRIRKLRLGFYVSSIWVHLYITATSIALRRVFLLETVPGQLKLSTDSSRTHAVFSARFFWKMYVRTLPKIFVVWMAAMYVQVVSTFELRGLEDFVWFTAGSLALKLLVKQAAKMSVVKFHVKDPRSIFVVAGLPTVLIDTQVRIMVQKMQSNQYTLVWTTAMAAFEVAVRVTKVFYTRRQIRRRQARVLDVVPTAIKVSPQAASNRRTTGPRVMRIDSLTTWRGFERWQRQILLFQIAESYANMSAEYIAIGCSTCILYFYWGHPRYSLGGDPAAFADASILPSSQLSALGMQLAVEVAVDYCSCAVEICEGVDFQQIQQYRGFLALLFLSFAAVNVQLCAVLYVTVS